VNSFTVLAGTILLSAPRAKRVSPRVMLTTIAPHAPLRVRLLNSVVRSLVSAASLRGDVKRSAGTTGGRARPARVLRELRFAGAFFFLGVGRLACRVERACSVRAATAVAAFAVAAFAVAAGSGANSSRPATSASERQRTVRVSRKGVIVRP
jgi:hypothetical protein